MSHEIVPYGKGKGKSIDDAQLRKFTKRTVDYGSDVVRWMEDCVGRRTRPRRLQRHYNYTKELVPPFAMPRNPYDGICPRFVYAAVNKNRSPVYVATWFPNGRRILTGTLAGEMTIWNGLAFHSENVMQAHNAGIKAMCWTPDEAVMVSGDQLGMIKLWDPFIYNFQTFQGHKDSVCDIAVAPTGEKFCSCADDSHAKVWDLKTGEEERAFTGHGWDVKCCAWHPTKGLVATGSKDSQIKLWDPRASEAITTIFCHKNTVTRVAWSPHGQWLASASRDQLVMLMDVRTMSVRKVFKAHQKEVTSLCWHPESDSLLASGGYDGAIHFWGIHGSSSPVESLPLAHEGPVWSLAWHPMGHLLVSASNEDGHAALTFYPLGSSRQALVLVEEAARKAKLRLLCANRPGNGSTSPPLDPPEGVSATAWHLETAVDDARALLAKLQIVKVSILFFCAGTPFALRFASKYPELCTGRMLGVAPWVSPADCQETKGFFRWASSLPTCVVSSVGGPWMAAGSYFTKSLPSTSLARAGLEKEEAMIFDREAVKMAARFRCLFQARVGVEKDSLVVY
ncbi:Wdr33 [Symbiodinium sp. CCMP2592]|nr:Wdr33 [Symbiodinium sp. CCMP2592]